MNERIRELIEQAGFGLGSFDFDSDPEMACGSVKDLEKFAELIVRECMTLMNKEQEYYSKPDPHESRDYYERCRAKEDAFDEAALIIKNHFGVEE